MSENEVVDMKLVLETTGIVAEGKVPEGIIVADMTVLNRMAVALKGALNIPGVKAVSETSMADLRKRL